MAITLDLTTEQEAQLKERAKAGGSDVNGYCQKLLAKQLSPQHEGKTLLDYKVGDSISGEAITAIDFMHPQFLIFRNKVGDIGYVIKDVKSDRAQTEFQRWKQKVDLELRGVFREQTNRLLASCLASYLLDEKGGDGEVEEYFEPLAKFMEAQNSVEYVYGRDSDWIVYLSNKTVYYEYSKLPVSLVEAMTKFHRLWHVSLILLEEEDKAQVNSILGSELTWLFRSGQSSAATSFNSSAEFLDDRKGAPARSYYILFSVASSFVLLSMVGFVRYVLGRYGISSSFILSGCVGGIIGATISIIQRGVTLTVNPFLDKTHLVFQGLVRVFLGMIFGGLLVVASKANITMGILKDNVWSLFIFSIVAGFSERFIPDVLARFANEHQPK
jgi:hypothetical protein